MWSGWLVCTPVAASHLRSRASTSLPRTLVSALYQCLHSCCPLAGGGTHRTPCYLLGVHGVHVPLQTPRHHSRSNARVSKCRAWPGALLHKMRLHAPPPPPRTCQVSALSCRERHARLGCRLLSQPFGMFCSLCRPTTAAWPKPFICRRVARRHLQLVGTIHKHSRQAATLHSSQPQAHTTM